jgi:hypothetical protein
LTKVVGIKSVMSHNALCTRELLTNVARQVINVDTCKCVWLAGVSTKSDQFRVGHLCGHGFGGEGQDTVIIPNDAAVPL